MLTPFYLLNAPERVVGLYSELEEFIIHDIARRLAKTGKLTSTAAYQAARAKELGTAKVDIAKEVAYTLDASEKYISQTLYDATMDSLEADDTLYKKAGKSPTPPQQSRYIQNYVKAMSRQTQGEMKNFTRSMGFQTATGFKKIAQYYQHALDFAHLKITTGATDYNTAIRQAVKEISDSGLRFVDYKSGWVNRADVAVRRAVLTGIQQTAGHLAEMRADEMGVSTMEITAHAGARPSHAVWQGQVVDRSGQDSRFLTLNDIGYGAGDGFKGWNCRHDWAPFIPGISVPSYTPEQLKNIDPPPVEYNGKTYTYYEATQRQRQIETAIRKTKREIIAYDGAGDKDMFTAKSVLIRRQREEYAAFSKAAGLRVKPERAGVLGYGHSKSMKAVWAERKEVSKYEKIRYNKDGTIVVTDDWTGKGKVSVPREYKPNAVVDTKTVYKDGSEQIDRSIYGADAMLKKQIHSGPHNRPKAHPYGQQGEHGHDYEWADDGSKRSRTARELTDREKKEHKDLL